MTGSSTLTLQTNKYRYDDDDDDDGDGDDGDDDDDDDDTDDVDDVDDVDDDAEDDDDARGRCLRFQVSGRMFFVIAWRWRTQQTSNINIIEARNIK